MKLPTLKSKKVQRKIWYKLIFYYSYTADSPLPKHVCIFFRYKYFAKYGWLKGKRVYVIVSKNKTFLTIKYRYQN